LPPLPGDVTHLLGLDGSTWFDYPVNTSAEVPNQSDVLTTGALVAGGTGNVCLSTVTIATPVTAAAIATPTGASLPCTATQVTFSPRLEAEFVTGVDSSSCTATDSVIHGYSVLGQKIITPLTTIGSAPITPLSGGVLSDGRKLYIGTGTAGTATTPGTAALHRFDLSTGTATTGNLLDGSLTEDMSIPIELVPSFVAVVPK
jgi:hypothetical protein